MPVWGPPPPPTWGYRSGYWYRAPGANNLTNLVNANELRFAPIAIATTHTFTAIGLEVATSASTGSATRLGIYYDNNGAPGNLLLDAGTIPSSCVAGTGTIAINQSLSPGMYWLASVSQLQSTSTAASVVTQPTVRRLNLDDSIVGMSTPLSQTVTGYIQVGTTGALPNPAVPATGSAGDQANIPAVMIQAQ